MHACCIYICCTINREQSFVQRCYRPLFAYSSYTPGAPLNELVPLALSCDMYSKQHMEATLLGQQHKGTWGKKMLWRCTTVLLMFIPSSQDTYALLLCILKGLYTAKLIQTTQGKGEETWLMMSIKVSQLGMHDIRYIFVNIQYFPTHSGCL